MLNVVRTHLIELRSGVPTRNPASGLEFLEEYNIYDRILTPEEFTRMLKISLDYLRLVLQWAYHTGMHKGEIWGLTCDRVDFKAGCIPLQGIDTKIGEARSMPVGRDLRQILRTYHWHGHQSDEPRGQGLVSL